MAIIFLFMLLMLLFDSISSAVILKTANMVKSAGSERGNKQTGGPWSCVQRHEMNYVTGKAPGPGRMLVSHHGGLPTGVPPYYSTD